MNVAHMLLLLLPYEWSKTQEKIFELYICGTSFALSMLVFLLFSRNEINSQWNCFFVFSTERQKELYKLESAERGEEKKYSSVREETFYRGD